MIASNLNSRNIADCVPYLQAMHQWIMSEWDKRYPDAPNPVVVQTYRAPAIQEVFYLQGRSDTISVNLHRKKLGLAPIQNYDNKIITKKKEGGKHNVYPSQAVDYLFIDGRRILTDKESQHLYMNLTSLIHEKFPMIVWGADWNNNGTTEDEIFIDMPHYQV